MQYEIIRRACNAGEMKATRPLGRLFTLSMLAGAFVSLGGLLSLIIGFGFPQISSANPGMQKLLSALTFPVGLFLIVLFGADLFTGNNGLLIPALNEKRIGWFATLRNWTLVWVGNFIGVLLFVVLLVIGTGMFESEIYRNAITGVAQAKVTMAPLEIFLRGIGANWCVCLAVWLALDADTMGAKALACWIPVGAFVALGYEHCIANMFFIPCGMAAGADITVAGLLKNLLFSTIGNVIGGALMVGHLFHRLYGKQK